jgi:hypothetical protein
VVATAVACRGPADHDTTGAASSATSAPAPNQWPLDRTAEYKLALSTVSDTGQSPVAVLLSLTASVDVTFRRSETGMRAELSLRDVQLLDHAKRPADGAGQLAHELERPFGFELNQAGQLAAYYEAPDSSPYASGYRRQLASLFQAPPAKATEAREWDATGLARVQYGVSAGGAQTYRKLDYERVLLTQSRKDDALDASKVKPQIVSSEGTTSVDAQGLRELHRHEELKAALTADRSISTSLSVSLLRSTAAVPAAPAQPQLFTPDRRRGVDTPINTQRRVSFDEVMIGGRTFPEIVAQYEKWSKTPEGVDGVPAADRASYFRALVGLLKTKPETLSLARKELERSSPVRDTLVDALGMASTPECAALLGELFFSPKSSQPLKIRAATALIRAPEPSQPGLAALERMIPDETFREHGLLGIGTYTRLFRQQPNANLAERATARLKQELEAAQSPRVRALVLLAIANSGASPLYELSVAEQSSKTADVRHAAIQAIRLMDDARVEPRLVALLEAKDESDVQSALQALGRRETTTATLVARVQDLARTHTAPMVRREAVLTLVKWREKWPTVEPVLKDCAEKDSDKRVREAALGKATPPTLPAPLRSP